MGAATWITESGTTVTFGCLKRKSVWGCRKLSAQVLATRQLIAGAATHDMTFRHGQRHFSFNKVRKNQCSTVAPRRNMLRCLASHHPGSCANLGTVQGSANSKWLKYVEMPPWRWIWRILVFSCVFWICFETKEAGTKSQCSALPKVLLHSFQQSVSFFDIPSASLASKFSFCMTRCDRVFLLGI